jgi:hypothetical protein
MDGSKLLRCHRRSKSRGPHGVIKAVKASATATAINHKKKLLLMVLSFLASFYLKAYQTKYFGQLINRPEIVLTRRCPLTLNLSSELRGRGQGEWAMRV